MFLLNIFSKIQMWISCVYASESMDPMQSEYPSMEEDGRETQVCERRA